jgi:accessory gene regulator protein AgrB
MSLSTQSPTEPLATPAATQRRWTSLVESIVNCIAGVIVAFGMQIIAFPWFGIHIELSTSGWIALLFTAVSIVRSYVLRRAFEWLRVSGVMQ